MTKENKEMKYDKLFKEVWFKDASVVIFPEKEGEEALVKNSLKVIKDNSDQEETSEIIPNINQISDSKWIA